jgi:hypothetical protein
METKPTVGNGRDENGRLLPGFTANPKGRPKKKTFRDYFSEEEEADLISKVKEVLKDKPEILRMAVEQIFGKPKQNVELSGDKNNPIPILNVSTNNGNPQDNESQEKNPGDSGRDGSLENNISNPVLDSLGTERQDTNTH